MRFKNPKEKLKSNLSTLMKEAGLWRDELLDDIPSSWEKYNNFVIFSDRYFQSKEWNEIGPRVWSEVCKVFSVDNVAIKGRIQCDGYRTPKVKLLWGTSNKVEYTDNGIYYSWNLEHNMFCSGNASERHRVAKLDCKNEIIVDLFTGIGYFTLPLLVHAKCKHVHACEWNPYAVSMLKNNLERNGVADRCTVYEGDNREMCPSNLADRIVLGLIPTSRNSWDVACQALNSDRGGVLHIHENINSKMPGDENKCINDNCEMCKKYFNQLGKITTDFPIGLSFEIIIDNNGSMGHIARMVSEQCVWKRYEWLSWAIHTSHTIMETLEKINSAKWKTIVQNLNHVKSYAPHIDHLVLDLECRPWISSQD